MTSLRRQLAVPTTLVAVVAAAALAWVAFDAAVMTRALRRDAGRVRAASALTLALEDAIHDEERRVAVLATRTTPDRTLADADADIARLVGALDALGMDPASRAGEVWVRFLESREELRPLRAEVVAASRAGDPRALGRTLGKWHLMSDRTDALLADLTAYHLKLLDRTVAALQDRHARGLWTAGAILGLALLVAFAFTRRVVHTVVRPVNEIARAAERVTATGLPAPVAGAGRTDELGSLARSFNAMTARLLAANAQLAEAVRARDEFISVASHELRTPLTPLQLRVQQLVRALAREGGAEPALLRGGLDLEKHVTRVGKLVDAMLDVSRITSGRLTLRVEELRLSEVVEDALERTADELRAAGCPTQVELEGDVRIVADRARLEQVIVNLTGNAAKYAPGSPVVVRVRTEPGAAVVEVEDRGPGIAPEDQDRVFTRFERAVPDQNEVSGLGLGLYIAREIARAHGGDISLRSKVGHGSAFAVSLPHARDGAPPPQRQAFPKIT